MENGSMHRLHSASPCLLHEWAGKASICAATQMSSADLGGRAIDQYSRIPEVREHVTDMAPASQLQQRGALSCCSIPLRRMHPQHIEVRPAS
mmetsp:Transcript_20728/g.36512  ORF Transcript_20728/g.36512 Transcript_20728/m.36512 type:complete len:92 (-) Transcript_20728:208-483(-)